MTRRPKTAVLLLAAALLAAAAPLAAREPPPTEPKKDAERPGLVITVEGIGGMDPLGFLAAPAFRKAGLPHEVRRFVWTHGTGKLLKDLRDTRHMVRKADELAVLLRELRVRDPDRPIYLVARSGGTGLTLFALEALPPATVDRVIFLAAAVSPSYDLRPALRAVKHELVSFHSPYDQLVLNWGTRSFGTADRFYGPSAGLYGFVPPPGLDAEGKAQYARLVQVTWQSRMLLKGHTGGHLGSGLPGFLVTEVAPWLRDERPATPGSGAAEPKAAPKRPVLAPPEEPRRGD